MTTTTTIPAAAPPAHRRAAGRPRWERPALAALLLATAALYLWDLSASGYANSFYSAAAQAGGTSWKAFLFGSLDAGNAITVDKPPAALWPMALSVRLFGLGAWQILVPQALMGVGTVAVVYAAVRRVSGAAGGLIAGAVLALTPVAALMFRFNNPDAALALLMAATVYFVVRGLEDGRTRWLAWAGAMVGLAFLVKTLQAFLILPPLALVYAVCGPTRLRRRLGQLALAGVVLVVSGGWWVALVELWPESSRPYVGGSQHNSFLELTFGYNGLGRLNGEETGSVGGGAPGGGGPGGGGGGAWGDSGIGRMFSDSIGGQIAWLLPAALILLAAALVLTRRAARTDVTRAAFLAWGGSLLATAAVFSFMAGIFHEYYTVGLAPYLAAVCGMGAVLLWRHRRDAAVARWGLAAAVAATAVWSYALLTRTEDWQPWLRWVVLVLGLVAAVGLVIGRTAGGRTSGADSVGTGPGVVGPAEMGPGIAGPATAGRATAGRLPARIGLMSAGAALIACLLAPLAYTAATVTTAHTGSIVTAGPASAQRGPGAGGGRPPGGGAGMQAAPGQGGQNGQNGQGSQGGKGGQAAPGGQGGQAGPGGQSSRNGQGGQPGGKSGSTQPGGQTGGSQTTPGQRPGPGTAAEGGMGGGRGGGMGGLLNGQKVSSKLAKALAANASDYTWIAATTGAQNAASYQLSTELPVMAIGGFNGSDPSPTLAEFKRYAKEGRIHYYLGGAEGGGMPGSDSGTAPKIADWVEKTYTKRTIDGVTVYDLTAPKSD
ncbi:glycosyltransferase family 39 protein [Streptomyces boninensis]|uniref:glycosyltransferase family 39 protein n=1 Tax=Streptomyces boninensis TaxID=2039455 RepID=UPI003B21F90F